MTTRPPIRWARATAAAISLLLACPLLASAKTLAQKKAAAQQQFDYAEKLREDLNGSPQSERTRREYDKVIEAYHRVYVITPNSSKADASILAQAELLTEQGRAFGDEKLSEAAIKQYKFLQEQYPGSRYRTGAMFAIAKIYQDDLHDSDAAKAAFEDFLQKHPQHPLSPQARQAIEEIDHPSLKKQKSVQKQEVVASRQPTQSKQVEVSSPAQTTADEKPVERLINGRRPLVTGIRHWSTPDYTRVAIDLEQEVPYEAGRIPSPDRIFFDLHGTKLAPELAGKSFPVDDGFLKKIRVAQYQVGMTRVVLEVDPVSEYSAFLLPNPYRLIVDIHGRQAKANALASNSGDTSKEKAQPAPATAASLVVKAGAKPAEPIVTATTTSATSQPQAATKSQTESAQNKKLATDAVKPEPSVPTRNAKEPDTAQEEVKATTKPTTAPTFQAVTPREQPKSSKEKDAELARMTREAQPSSDGQRSLIRTLGLKIGKIVVDAGHGGHDTGTIGPRGLMEKDLVLDVSLRLGKLLQNKLGADVVFTRNDDTFVPLETRTAIANKEEADLFISVHANSSRDPSARGVETYYLNFTSSQDALEVAARENAVSEASIHELQDLVKKIALKEKIEESREFAGDVQKALHTGLSTRGNSMRDRGVKKAPFIVLIGANMPSVLAEISFVSNPKDEKKLQAPDYRQKIAESLYRGISEYIRGLSGVKVASASTAAGQ